MTEKECTYAFVDTIDKLIKARILHARGNNTAADYLPGLISRLKGDLVGLLRTTVDDDPANDND
ncbi:MAG: hypothetical protein GQ565_03020 [Candidatus Aegiribacteria sp.]|nr:hypothetical protein [Candidatus Aegiribacteria sp.]